MNFLKPKRLQKDDTVGLLSVSWGGPSVFPHVYELGLGNIEKLGLKIKEFSTARADADFLYENPKARADDVNRAFADPEVDAIISTIGGEDSIRILPYLDSKAIRANPKIVMGYSDFTTILVYCNRAGNVAFHGPSAMAGFSQMGSFPSSFSQHIREILFEPQSTYNYRPYESYSEGYPDWADASTVGKTKSPKPSDGWHWLQGGSAKGELYGGNIEILEWLRGTEYWPEPEFWDDKILFLETSEEQPQRSYVRRWLRTFGVSGGLDRISGLLLGRARDYTDEDKKKLEENIVAVVSGEFGRSDLPLVTSMDFGHTDPQLIIPLGVKAEIDCENKLFRLLEPAVR